MDWGVDGGEWGEGFTEIGRRAGAMLRYEGVLEDVWFDAYESKAIEATNRVVLPKESPLLPPNIIISSPWVHPSCYDAERKEELRTAQTPWKQPEQSNNLYCLG